MDKTNVMVKFIIYGDSFEPSFITEQLTLMPNETYMKGDPTGRSGINKRKETTWSISTGYEESYDINEQLKKILLLLNGKADKLVELKHSVSVEILFMIVVKIKNEEFPAMRLGKDIIHFMSTIGAEVDFDVYVFNDEHIKAASL
jgi:hypothetical protein